MQCKAVPRLHNSIPATASQMTNYSILIDYWNHIERPVDRLEWTHNPCTSRQPQIVPKILMIASCTECYSGSSTGDALSLSDPLVFLSHSAEPSTSLQVNGMRDLSEPQALNSFVGLDGAAFAYNFNHHHHPTARTASTIGEIVLTTAKYSGTWSL